MNFTAERYVDDVLAERIPACRWVRLACERHRRDLAEGGARGLHFDRRAGATAIAFFSVLRHWKGEWGGQVIKLEPAQQFWIWSLFGWKRANGSRRFRTGYLEVARKNGKTTTAAGVGLYLAFVDNEPGAEVYSAATKRDQAKICHADATQMVKRTPQLKQMIQVFRDNLHDMKSGSKFEPLSSDYNSLDGLNVHGVIADELHAWPTKHLWDVLEGGTGSRRQPLILAITTAGLDQYGICYQQRDYVEKILKGIVNDDAYWGIIYTLDTKKDWADLEEDDDWQDEKNWIKANPLLDVSKGLETMREMAHKAANIPDAQNGFLRQQLNIWTSASIRWINYNHWTACGRYAVDESALVGRTCYGGLDLSQSFDITALALVFSPEIEDEPYQVVMRFWLPADNMYERVRRDKVPYDVWVRQGYLRVTPGNVVDYEFIMKEIEDLMGDYDLREIAYDSWGAKYVEQKLQEIGGQNFIVLMRQGEISMSPPLKDLGKRLAENSVAHGNNPVLNWMADNLVVREGATGMIKPDKEKSREKIDGMVALVMALDRATRHYSEPRITIL